MASTNAYGTFNPGGIDPFPIETQLAQASVTSPADAYNMLMMYRGQNRASQEQYTGELDRQHDYARQQLSNQLYENQLKAMTEAPKTAGTLSLLSSSGMLPGIDPNVANAIETNLARAQAAKTAQEGGAGLASLDTAGYQTSPGEAANISGITNLTSGLSRAERVANINAAARIAAAHAGQPAGVGFSVQLPLDKTGGTPVTANIPGKLGGPAGFAQLRGLGYLPPEGQPNTSVVQPPASGATPTTPPPTTNTPPASGGAQRTQAAPSKAMQDAVADVKAGMVNGQVNKVTDPKTGKPGLKGASGRIYTD